MWAAFKLPVGHCHDWTAAEKSELPSPLACHFLSAHFDSGNVCIYIYIYIFNLAMNKNKLL